ncbi:uncharacterized protein [Pyxicephalus adspersus]|uniref:Uncharacterized protein n=1 Tax=Pyxicephalus adspersus TaxID=30357 RepID=A0AAV3AVQ6_PYXAD|nr:TPA: hypothetical protein GDO54_010421 [Pyxicephalus adspersus]
MEPQMSKKIEFKSVGPPGPKKNMESSKKGQGQSRLLEEVSSTCKPGAQKAESSPEAVTIPPEVNQGSNGEENYYSNQNSYLQQYYTQYAHLYHVLDSSLSAIHSELSNTGRNVCRLANGMKECSDTMEFYVTRMLSLQKEMLRALDKTNSSLQSAVYLLREIKESQEQRPQGSSSATRHMERDKASGEFDEASIRWKERENRLRSRSGDRSTQHRKKYKEN